MKNPLFFLGYAFVVGNVTSLAQNKPENIGSAVNTEYSELNPVMAPDGRTLYFGRKYSIHNLTHSLRLTFQ